MGEQRKRKRRREILPMTSQVHPPEELEHDRRPLIGLLPTASPRRCTIRTTQVRDSRYLWEKVEGRREERVKRQVKDRVGKR